MPVSTTKRAREESGKPMDEAAHRHHVPCAAEPKDAATAPLDRVVVLNVGGTKITTLQSTLCSSPSLLAEWARNKFVEFPRDLQGHPFLDRDPDNFIHILNYLRGYGLPNKPDDLVVIAEDAELYQFESLKREIGLEPPSMWRFTPGPGVQSDGVEFSTADILNVCGSEPLSTSLIHTMVFRVDKCELVSIGVVAIKDIQHDMQIRRQKNTVCYCNTGELVRYWSADALYEQSVLYKSPDEIMVRVEFAQPGKPLEVPCSTPMEQLPPPLHPIVPEFSSSTLPASISTPSGTTGAPIRPLPLAMASVSSGAEPLVTSPALEPGTPAVAVSRPPNPGSSSFLHTPTSAVTLPPLQALSGNAGSGTSGIQATHFSAVPATAGASPSLPFTSIVLDPEDPDAQIGAIVTFFKCDREVCRARWPAPVPPLQFAVSMQGASSVSIVRANSVSADAAATENEE